MAPTVVISRGSTSHDEITRLGSKNSMSSIAFELPDYEYPVPCAIRNTFIELQLGRPVSLDEFFEERRINSCPAPSASVSVDGGNDVKDSQPRMFVQVIASGAHALAAAAARNLFGSSSTHPTCDVQAGESAVANADCTEPRVIRLSEALPADQLPSLGSVGHLNGTCKPCAFFHKRQCENGLQCPFCHLCGPDAKKQRQKEKKSAFRDFRHARNM
jgi:hypothetical protein